MKTWIISLTFFLIVNSGYGQHQELTVTGNVSKNGYQYQLFPTGSGSVADKGDLVFFDMTVLYRDSILEDSRWLKTRPQYEIPDEAAESEPSPVYDALKLMRLGDSMVIYERVDTISDLPPDIAHWKEVSYRIKVDKLWTRKERDAVSAREPEVEKIVVEDLSRYKRKKYDQLIHLQDGVEILMHRQGAGSSVKKGDDLYMYYYGVVIEDGACFESSYRSGSPFYYAFGSGRIIEGLESALAVLRKGSAATIFIPSGLAYGMRGIPDLIPPDSNLAFYVEILE